MQPQSAAPKPKAFSYIRMSSEGQLKGDSLRRQVERSKLYAAEHGLDLDETTSFNDIGVSAFRGKNLKQGALSRFKEAVLTKKIAPGSYRLSFDVVPYFEAQGVESFYPAVHIIFVVTDPAQHYHVPLLLSPFGYSTYRGS